MGLFDAFKKALEAVGVLKKEDFDSKLDIKLSEHRDALKGADNKDFSTLEADIESILAQLDIKLSTLRDALRGVDARTLTDLYNKIDSLLSELQPVSTSGSIVAADNTDGFTLELDKGGRPFVDVYYKVSDAADIYIEVSIDGSTWRVLDSTSPAGAEEKVLQYPWVGHKYVRVRTPTTGIDVVFEISASR